MIDKKSSKLIFAFLASLLAMPELAYSSYGTERYRTRCVFGL
jgi:hypothetical protein